MEANDLGLTPKTEKAFQEFIDKFSFSEVKSPIVSPMILIAGVQGVGKTHLSLTITENPTIKNVFFLDTELRGSIVVSKFNKTGKIKYAKIKTYMQLLAAVEHITKKYPPKETAVIIDSGSDLQQFAEIKYKEIAKLEKVWPQYLWSNVYDLADKIITILRESGIVSIITARMKEEYIADKPTGKFLPRVYNRLPYNVDIIFELKSTTKDREIIVTKNGYTGVEDKVPYNTLPNLIKQLTN